MLDLRPVDYLLVGHVAVDRTPTGAQLGGTVAYAARTAQALGWRVGVVTSAGADAPLERLQGIQIVNLPTEHSAVFENIQTKNGRRQILHSQAAPISFEQIPLVWRDARIVHLAPIAQEIESDLAELFPNSWVGVTPQGWMRDWDARGLVRFKEWKNSERVLSRVGGVILSLEDVEGDLERVEQMAQQARLLCLTEGERGAVLYWNGDRRRFRPLPTTEIDAIGAGDIFATAFFIRLQATKDPWEAARFAVCIAAHSVTRVGLQSVPTQKEIELCAMEVLT